MLTIVLRNLTAGRRRLIGTLSVHERTRELGLLRAVGLTRSQTRALVRWESLLVALFGTLGGVALGTFLAWTLVRAAGSSTAIGFAASPAALLLILAAGAVAGVARPAWTCWRRSRRSERERDGRGRDPGRTPAAATAGGRGGGVRQLGGGVVLLAWGGGWDGWVRFVGGF